MDLLCRNPACIYHVRPIDVVVNHNQCPHCKWPLLGDSHSMESPPPPPSSAAVGDTSPSRNGGPTANTKPTTPSSAPAPASATSYFKGLFGRKKDAELPEEPLPPPVAKSPDTRSKVSSQPKKKKRPSPDSKPAPAPSMTPGPEPVIPGKATLVPAVQQPGISHKPQYVLERVFPDRVEALDFIEQSLKTPLYYDDPATGRRDVAYLKNTAMGVVLTPKDPTEGVFVRIKSPRRLVTGSRIRIGNYVIEARLPQRAEPPVKPSDPPEFNELVSQGELIFLRADGSAGVSFPLLRKVLIGRGQPGDELVDIPLLDPSVSRLHASITPLEGGLKLKDLKSTHGTFIEVREATYLDEGDSFRIGDMLLRLVSYPRTTI
jgi:FHA domain